MRTIKNASRSTAVVVGVQTRIYAPPMLMGFILSDKSCLVLVITS